MSASRSQPTDEPDDAVRRAQFDAEVRVAGLSPSADDREHLYVMWANDRPVRERLRAADLALEEEPSFTQKPAQPGAGITLSSTSAPRGGPA